MEILRQFAATSESAQSGGLLETLGIDWKILLFQITAFLVTVWFLGKFVYPILMKSVDDRAAKIEASEKAATEVQAASENTEKRIAKLMTQAKSEANEIVSSAKAESAAVILAAEEKSKKRSEQIAADAQVQIEKEVLAAQRALRDQTVELVALATGKVVSKTVVDNIDNALIVESIKDVEK
jgi:F-type H+-transporting ATPase subunit b